MSCSLTVNSPFLLTAYCLLLTAYCLLLTAYCLLLTAYCLLLTAYCLLSSEAYSAGGLLTKQPLLHCRFNESGRISGT